LAIAYNVKNKSSMETELRKILTEIYRGQKENNDEAVERILLLLNVVGRSEQLSNEVLENAIAKAKPNMDKINDVDEWLDSIR
jgi:hypothetical protein